MPKINRKRKTNKNINCPKHKRKKDLNELIIEAEKENLAEINNNITIIRLPDNVLESSGNDDDDDEDEDCDWENVSELDDKSDIIVNLHEENFDGLDEKNDEKRLEQKFARELRESIHKTMLMSLIGRAMFINKICSKNEVIMHLAMSCLPGNMSKYKEWNESNLKELFNELLLQFEIENSLDESGDVNSILIKSFNTKRVSSVWVNVLFVSMLRRAGIKTRLIAAIYPIPLKKSTSNDIKEPKSESILCPPTVHKPSTRGGKSKTAKNPNVKKKFSFNIQSKTSKTNTIVFSIELLNEKTHRWIPVDASDANSWNDMSCVIQSYPRILYCIAIDNEGFVKDVAAKYDVEWATTSRRQRLPETAYSRIFIPYFSSVSSSQEDIIENSAIKAKLIDQGVPLTLADVKGHPIFVLKSHLLKYEVLYPHDVTPVGWLRKEEIYLRDNVKLAHTKETWLKEAKVIKSGEIPCKKVKTLSSRRREKESGSDPFVELFGPWQVENYIPPTASNGVIPKNKYGNVDLFKPSMLPVGCSRLFLKDLDKITSNLGIDCVPAMVGWAFTKKNKARPIYDGWVVCNEHVDVVKEAWNEINAVKQAKIAERRQNVVIKRWEMLTRRLLLKERLKLEYNF